MVKTKSIGELERENEELRNHIQRLECSLLEMIKSYDLVMDWLDLKKSVSLRDVTKGFFNRDVEAARKLISGTVQE